MNLLAWIENFLSADLDATLDDAFDALCRRLGVSAEFYADELGCKCPYALVGYLEAAENDE